MISGLTTSMRFDGSLCPYLDEMYSTLVSYPRFHFLIASYAPFIPASKPPPEPVSVAEISYEAFLAENVLSGVDPRHG